MQDTGGHSFESYYKRALGPLVVLYHLAGEPKYTYELSQILKSKSGGRFSKTLLYPVLYRLAEQGHIEVSGTEVVDNRARTYYRITESGRAFLASLREEFTELTRAAFLILDIDGYGI